ncbi:MAG: radical SAM protein, partial [Planctomycetota bacterium]
MPPRPTVSIKTVGCRLNQAESATIAAQFENAGYEIVPFGRRSDVVVVHGCAVTRNAERKSIRFARAARQANRGAFVVLTGCVIEATVGAAFGQAEADMAAGRDLKFRLPSILAEHGFPPPLSCDTDLLPRFETSRAWVKVQDGCDFGCTYCVVPLARGEPTSVAPAEVVTRVGRLAEAGYREVVLTGANLVCYQHGDTGLVDLLQRIEEIEGIERIRLSSIELSAGEQRMIDYMADSAKLCRFLHLPLQSGDDLILQKMGRRYTA